MTKPLPSTTGQARFGKDGRRLIPRGWIVWNGYYGHGYCFNGLYSYVLAYGNPAEIFRDIKEARMVRDMERKQYRQWAEDCHPADTARNSQVAESIKLISVSLEIPKRSIHLQVLKHAEQICKETGFYPRARDIKEAVEELRDSQ